MKNECSRNEVYPRIVYDANGFPSHRDLNEITEETKTE